MKEKYGNKITLKSAGKGKVGVQTGLDLSATRGVFALQLIESRDVPEPWPLLKWKWLI